MRGKLNIQRVDRTTGEREVVYEAYNQITQGIKHAFVNVLTGTGSDKVEDYKFRYFQLGDQKYDLNNYNVSADVTAASLKSKFWTIKSPLTKAAYGINSKMGVTNLNLFAVGSVLPVDDTTVIDNFVDPPDATNMVHDYSNNFGWPSDGVDLNRGNQLSRMPTVWDSGCADAWEPLPENKNISPLSAHADYDMSGPGFTAPTYRVSYTSSRDLIQDDGVSPEFTESCIKPGFGYVFKGGANAGKSMGEIPYLWNPIKKNQTMSYYTAGVHYLSSTAQVSGTPTAGACQLFNRMAMAQIHTTAGQNRMEFAYRYDYDNVSATYTPSAYFVSSGWQRNEDKNGDSAEKFLAAFGLSSEEEYGVVSGNIYNRYGPIYTYQNHLEGYVSAGGAGAAYMDTSNVGFGPSGNFYRVSTSWNNVPDGIIDFYKMTSTGAELNGGLAVPFVIPICSSLAAINTSLPFNVSAHQFPGTVPRSQVYLSHFQWEFNPEVSPNQVHIGERPFFVTKPQDVVTIPEGHSTRLHPNTTNVRLVVDENLANNQTINEVGVLLKNPGGNAGKDVPYLAAYKALEYPLNKSDQFSYLIDWEFSFIDEEYEYVGIRTAYFRNSQPTRFEGWLFPTAGDPKFNQLTVYPDFRDADSSGYVYYDVNIDLDYPASAGTEIAYTVSGTGTTNNYLVKQPWSIVEGYESPLSLGTYDTSTFIRVRLDASAGLSTWNEYSLIFKLVPAGSSKVEFPSSYSMAPSDEFRLYSKTAVVSSVMDGATFKGCTMPPVLWFSGTAPEGPKESTIAVPVMTHGDSGFGLPSLNEPCYWYWTSAGGNLVSGDDWLMTDSGGNEVSQGEYVISGDNPKIYIKSLNANTGTISISGNYERVDLSAQGVSSFSLVSAMDENLWNGTDKWSPMWPNDPNNPPEQLSKNVNRDLTWPDTPSSGTWVSNSHVFHQPILNLPDSSATDSRGRPLRVHYITSSYASDINVEPHPGHASPETKIPYMRTDLEGEYFADGSLDYFPIKRYTLFSVKVQDPSPSSGGMVLSGGPGSDYGPSQYFRISLRDKSSNVQVSSYPLPSHPDGESNATVNFDQSAGNGWVVCTTQDDDYPKGSGDNPPDVSGGVVSGTDHAGNAEFTLWVLRDDEPSLARRTYAGVNMLARPIYCPSGSLKESALGSDWAMLSGALCMYDPFLQSYASSAHPDIINLASNILPEFWPRDDNQWEPRGGFVTPKAGSTFSNTFTLSVTA